MLLETLEISLHLFSCPVKRVSIFTLLAHSSHPYITLKYTLKCHNNLLPSSIDLPGTSSVWWKWDVIDMCLLLLHLTFATNWPCYRYWYMLPATTAEYSFLSSDSKYGEIWRVFNCSFQVSVAMCWVSCVLACTAVENCMLNEAAERR
jgi:hypothetical protein